MRFLHDDVVEIKCHCKFSLTRFFILMLRTTTVKPGIRQSVLRLKALGEKKIVMFFYTLFPFVHFKLSIWD